MEEKIYTTKRKGMAVLLTVLFVYLQKQAIWYSWLFPSLCYHLDGFH